MSIYSFVGGFTLDNLCTTNILIHINNMRHTSDSLLLPAFFKFARYQYMIFLVMSQHCRLVFAYFFYPQADIGKTTTKNINFRLGFVLLSRNALGRHSCRTRANVGWLRSCLFFDLSIAYLSGEMFSVQSMYV